jgi:uncharacterized protein YbjT (DUF2867 family)
VRRGATSGNELTMVLMFVIEATGKVGPHVVSGLLERNERVRAVARDPNAAARTRLASPRRRSTPGRASSMTQRS